MLIQVSLFLVRSELGNTKEGIELTTLRFLFIYAIHWTIGPVKVIDLIF